MKAKKTVKKPLRKRRLSWWERLQKVLKDHFIPHKGNAHVPHTLKHRALFGYSALMIALKVFVVSASIALPAASLYSSAITPTNIISLTNETRKSLSLPALQANDALSISAQRKAEDMVANQYFAHTSPTGVTPWSWIKGAGYEYKYAGENLAVYFTEAEDVHAGWMASPTHRANIVDGRYTEIGVGVAQGMYNGYPAVFVVQHFGFPVISAIPAPTDIPNTAVAAPTPTPAQNVLGAEVTQETLAATVTPNPGSSSYNVNVQAEDASAVTAHLGTNSTSLTKTPEGTWTGDLSYNAASLADHGEQLYVVAKGETEDTVSPVALVAPETETKDLYAFEKTPEARLFGVIKVSGLDDSVRRFYLYAMLALGAVLLLTVLAKFQHKHIPIATHALAVIGLALLLSIF